MTLSCTLAPELIGAIAPVDEVEHDAAVDAEEGQTTREQTSGAVAEQSSRSSGAGAGAVTLSFTPSSSSLLSFLMAGLVLVDEVDGNSAVRDPLKRVDARVTGRFLPL